MIERNDVMSKWNAIFGIVSKVLFIMVCTGFLYLYHQSSENNRFHFVESSKLGEDVLYGVFDSKTAKLYTLITKTNTWGVFSPFESIKTINLK